MFNIYRGDGSVRRTPWIWDTCNTVVRYNRQFSSYSIYFFFVGFFVNRIVVYSSRLNTILRKCIVWHCPGGRLLQPRTPNHWDTRPVVMRFFFSFYSVRIDSNKQSYSHRRDYGGSGDFISHSVYELSLNVLMIVKTVSEGGGCPEILDPLRNVSDILKIIIYLCTNLNIYDWN